MGEGHALAIGMDIGLVIVPIEEGTSGFMEAGKQSMFHLVQHIETHKDVAVEGQCLRVQTFQGIPLQHALVGNTQALQGFAVGAVNVPQLVPQGEEPFLQFRTPFRGEVEEEPAYGLALSGAEESGVVRQVFQILQVAKEAVGWYLVLVQVIEIADEQFSPEIEVIQRFLGPRDADKDLVQLAH